MHAEVYGNKTIAQIHQTVNVYIDKKRMSQWEGLIWVCMATNYLISTSRGSKRVAAETIIRHYMFVRDICLSIP